MRALVTGANGFIGEHLVNHLTSHGWEVGGVQRRGTITRLSAVYPSLDLTPEQLQGYDVIYHLAGAAHDRARSRRALQRLNVEATRKLLLAAQQAGVQKFVYTSSIKVLGEFSNSPVTPDQPLAPKGAYARSKAQAENELKEHSDGQTQIAIVRPPLVYGPGVGANFERLMNWGMSGWPLPLGAANAPRAWLGMANLTDFLRHVGDPHMARIQGVWHICDAEQTPVADLLKQIAALSGTPSRLFSVNIDLLTVLATFMLRRGAAKKLLLPLPVDMSETTESLEWSPPYDQASQLSELVTVS